MSEKFALRVNGKTHAVEVEPDTALLYVVRNDLGLYGAKYGCGVEQCGACNVLIDGEAVNSCSVTVAEAVGKDITTLEGLGTVGNLHPLQRAFLDHQAAQCGYCTSGIIIEAKALLDHNPKASDFEIRAALAHNLCRCGSHHRVIKAIKQAQREMA